MHPLLQVGRCTVRVRRDRNPSYDQMTIKTLQVTFGPLLTFAVAKAGIASNAVVRGGCCRKPFEKTEHAQVFLRAVMVGPVDALHLVANKLLQVTFGAVNFRALQDYLLPQARLNLGVRKSKVSSYGY